MALNEYGSKEYGSKEIKGIKISFFNACMIILTGILYLCLVFASVFIVETYETLAEHTNNYIYLRDQADRINEASDYLTEQVRLYARNMDVKHMELYFKEVDVTRSREHALAVLGEQDKEEMHEGCLQTAIDFSNELMERELYCMKMISVANGLEAGELPEKVRTVSLEAVDAALDKEAMIEKARRMVYDNEYLRKKEEIDLHLSHVTKGVFNGIQSHIAEGFSKLSDAITFDRLLLSALLTLNILTFVVIVWFVIRPLRMQARCIRDQVPLEVIGSYEFKNMALIYNNIYKLNADSVVKEAELRHKAEHDALTGLMNRSVFEQIPDLLEKAYSSLALLLIDVDQFKEINDTYGHEAGDQILKRVANLLTDNFRSKDYMFRIGGDEFAGVIVDVTKEQMRTIEAKIDRINSILQNPENGLPATSLSVGVAFSTEGYREELYRQADKALYAVKENGRCGCQFYHEENQ